MRWVFYYKAAAFLAKKPRYVQFNDYIERKGKQYVNITYKYRSDGTKVSKLYQYKDLIIANAFTTKITEYLDGFQYETESIGGRPAPPTPKFVPTAEGYYNFQNNKYIYSYTDHLGNVRLSYFNNGNGAEVLEENNYYPFGLKHEGYNPTAGNVSYRYKYNGKELQETGMYDYGARFYMPDIGRWGVVDPLAEKNRRFTPYNYAINNPIRFIDPDGRSESDWIRKNGVWEYDKNITTAEQAQKISGVDGFAENGTILSNVSVDGGTESAYAQLNEGGSISKLDTDEVGITDIPNMLSYTTWDPQEFPQLTDPGGMARNDFDASSHDKKFADDKTFILDIGNIPIPGNASTLRLPNIAEIFKNLESIGFTDAPDWYKVNKSDSTLMMYNTFTHDKNGAFKTLDTAKYIKDNDSTGFMRFMNAVDNQRRSKYVK